MTTDDETERYTCMKSSLSRYYLTQKSKAMSTIDPFDVLELERHYLILST